MTYLEEISNEAVNELPLLRYEGDVVVIDRKKGLKDMFHDLKHESFIGFDTETKPNFVKGRINEVALVQLATANMAYLVRINKTGLTDELIRLFESEMPKVGVALHDDIKGLQRYKPFQPSNFINVNKITHEMGIKNQGIRKLAGILLGGRVSKGQQLSNWEAQEYTPAQVSYAATDAWVGWKLYKQLLDDNHFSLRT